MVKVKYIETVLSILDQGLYTPPCPSFASSLPLPCGSLAPVLLQFFFLLFRPRRELSRDARIARKPSLRLAFARVSVENMLGWTVFPLRVASNVIYVLACSLFQHTPAEVWVYVEVVSTIARAACDVAQPRHND